MIKTDNLNEYVLLSVLKNFCEATINDSDCSECKMNAVCDYGLGSKEIKDLDIKYEPEQEEQIKENENAEEKQ